MTLLDINNQLIEFFLQNEKFSINENLKGISVPEEYIEYTKQLIVSSLDSLVSTGVLVKLSDDIYILKQPINNFTQSIIISPNIASAIADKCNMMTEDGDETSALNITEGDIVKLLIIIDTLLEETGAEPKE